MKGRLRSSCATVAALAVLQMNVAFAQAAGVTSQPPSSPLVRNLATDLNAEPALPEAQKLALLRQKVKYVFVLFQENRAFDHYFGTFPGAEGLFSKPASQTPGFVQPIVNTDGTVDTISPFLIPSFVTDINRNTVPIYPADTDSVDHSHTGINNSMDFDADYVARNDQYALDEEGLTRKNGAIVSTKTGLSATTPPTLVQKQRAELVLGHIDCDTIPFLWQYADRFALFDNFSQTVIGPSTPNAIAMIAGQSGVTQWALHPDQASSNASDPLIKLTGGQPVVSDPPPFNGSNFDHSPVKPPFGGENANAPALNQTYATLPLSFMGRDVNTITRADENPAADLRDIQADIQEVASRNMRQINWGWYQLGYDAEPGDRPGAPANSSYIVHHNGPQYFGYLADNTQEVTHLHGLNDFFTAIQNGGLPSTGGVFYLRGGYDNNDGLVPNDPNPVVRNNFTGNDDHPAYSDAQISEALLADEVDAIAQSPYWKDSAIIITYDETDGLYDHVPPRIRTFDPENTPLSGGPRIPAIVVSPFAKSHVVVHDYSEHSSVIKFIDKLFDLEPLADLPDEARARGIGVSALGKQNLGPADDQVPEIGDLFNAFDNGRLTGSTKPLEPSYAMIPAGQITALPHYNGKGCQTLYITPTDYKAGRLIDPAPTDFNPRPGTTPGIPTSGTWVP